MARLIMMPGDPPKDPPRPEPQSAPQATSSERHIHTTAERELSCTDDATSTQSLDSTMPTPSGYSLPADNDNNTNVNNTLSTKDSNLTEKITYIAHTDEDLIAALRLISDTVAQQRQLAAQALLSHRLYWTIVALPLPYFYVEWYHESSDWAVILVTWAGIFMVTLGVIKFLTRGYLDAAERVGRWSWLYGDQWIRNRFGRTSRAYARVGTDPHPGFKTDYVFATKVDGKIVAALVLRMTNGWEMNPSKSLVLNGDKLQKKAFIRAWAVKRRLRGNGIGIALLRFVVRWCLDNEIDGPEFSDDHAHSLRLLPLWVTSNMEKNDLRARTKVYWEIQHYNTPWWKEQREGQREPKGGQQGRDLKPKQEQTAPRECAYGPAAEDLLSTFQGVFSPRRKIELSQTITKKILSGE